MANRERLIESGWRQGVLLAPNDAQLKEHAHYKIRENDRLLIVSQTCDLVHGSFDNEPWFEVLCLHPLSREPDGSYLGGKNSRRIEFSTASPGTEPGNWYALPHERHLIDRQLLIDDLDPSAAIDDQTLKMVLAWLSRRYTRTAFPEAFVKRVDARKGPIGKKFSRLNPLVTNVYIRLSPFKELEDGNKYTVELMLVMDAATFDDEEKYKACDSIRKQLEGQLKKCAGVIVENVSIESSANVTIEELKGYLEWDYSYLSFRDPDNAATSIHT